MGKNLTRQEFLSDGTWTCPAGVSKVRVSAYSYLFGQDAMSAAISFDGTAWSWGSNANGQVGDGTVTNRSSPVAVLEGISFKQISRDSSSVMGVDGNGNVFAWGLNTNGQLALNDVTPRSSPVVIAANPNGTKWRQISVNANYGVGMDSGGLAYSWGLNTNGQLGDGTVTTKSSPVLVLGSKQWRQIFNGPANSLGIDSNGDAYAWGNNANGELGTNDVTPRSSPVLVVGARKWKQVGCFGSSQSSSFGIDVNNDLYAWGYNVSGQLGIGNVTPKSSPTLVLGGLKWKSIANTGTPISWAMGIATTGDAYAWGDNAGGELGLNDVTPRSSPVLVVGGRKWLQLAASSTSAFGIDSTGSAYGWGVNNLGQLGLNDTVNRSSPVLIVGGNIHYQSTYQSIINSVIHDVVPGTVYQVTIYGLLTMFNYTGIFQNTGFTGSTPIKVILEYQS